MAQSVGIGTSAPDASSTLDIYSEDQGLLVPRLTPVDLDSYPSPVQGSIVYVSGISIQGFVVYSDGQWEMLQSSSENNISGLQGSGTSVAYRSEITIEVILSSISAMEHQIQRNQQIINTMKNKKQESK